MNQSQFVTEPRFLAVCVSHLLCKAFRWFETNKGILDRCGDSRPSKLPRSSFFWTPDLDAGRRNIAERRSYFGVDRILFAFVALKYRRVVFQFSIVERFCVI